MQTPPRTPKDAEGSWSAAAAALSRKSPPKWSARRISLGLRAGQRARICERTVGRWPAYARTRTSEAERARAIAVRNVHYNYRRPHTTAGFVEEVGSEVSSVKPGQFVIGSFVTVRCLVPFVSAVISFLRHAAHAVHEPHRATPLTEAAHGSPAAVAQVVDDPTDCSAPSCRCVRTAAC
ncbi:hypothetical protein [Streptomyces sp. NRRL B-24720]|uniref:hypothetical protein n=1 Tax=Streptomyces sp. NRRL B-24720 TaxID=1476876 RepID=UPI000AF027C8|nr:hypothetical protein [Streptomyces sp. NRRL B-24720]